MRSFALASGFRRHLQSLLRGALAPRASRHGFNTADLKDVKALLDELVA